MRNNNWKLSRRSELRLAGVDHRLIKIAKCALELSSVDFGIPEFGGLRAGDEQAALYAAGKSKCNGTTKKSYHQLGKALDFYAYVDGAASWEPEHLTTVAAAFLQAASELGYCLQWGGHWKNFKDMPHVQLI